MVFALLIGRYDFPSQISESPNFVNPSSDRGIHIIMEKKQSCRSLKTVKMSAKIDIVHFDIFFIDHPLIKGKFSV